MNSSPIHPKLVVGAGGTLTGTLAAALSVLLSKANGQTQTALSLLIAIIGVAVTVLVVVIGYFTPSKDGVSPAGALEANIDKRLTDAEATLAKVPGLAAAVPAIEAVVGKVQDKVNATFDIASSHATRLGGLEDDLGQVKTQLSAVTGMIPGARSSTATSSTTIPPVPMPPAQTAPLMGTPSVPIQ
jgi:hypothetical protein